MLSRSELVKDDALMVRDRCGPARARQDQMKDLNRTHLTSS